VNTQQEAITKALIASIEEEIVSGKIRYFSTRDQIEALERISLRCDSVVEHLRFDLEMEEQLLEEVQKDQ
jgi:hypothetical protein